MMHEILESISQRIRRTEVEENRRISKASNDTRRDKRISLVQFRESKTHGTWVGIAYFFLFLHSLNQLFECVQISWVGIDVEKMAFAVDEEVGGELVYFQELLHGGLLFGR